MQVPLAEPAGAEEAALPEMPLTDPFGRRITYLRVSVTDRCDMRCLYCMSEHMHFLPKRDLLTLEELDRLTTVFIRRGVRKLRITGGEPLVRRDIMSLFRGLSRHFASGGLEELTLTTNGSQLSRFAMELVDCGVRRVNVSLDSLDPAKFRRITRWGDLEQVMAGIDAAQQAGLGGQDQHRGAEGGQRGRDRDTAGMGAWPGHGPHVDRGHADGRYRAVARRTVLALVACSKTLDGSFHLGGYRLPHGRTSPVRSRQGDGRETGLHHADDP